jgi:hypothetical protein
LTRSKNDGARRRDFSYEAEKMMGDDKKRITWCQLGAIIAKFTPEQLDHDVRWCGEQRDEARGLAEHYKGGVRDLDALGTKMLGEVKAERDRLRMVQRDEYTHGIEAAAKLMEENAECFTRSGQRELAYQLIAEARHIRELKP